MLLAYWGTRERPAVKYQNAQEQRAYRKVHKAVFDAADVAQKLAKDRPVALFVPLPTSNENAIDTIEICFGYHYGPQMTFQWDKGGQLISFTT